MTEGETTRRPLAALAMAAGVGALVSGLLWRPDLASALALWLSSRRVVLPWRRSCPVPRPDPGT